MPSYYYSEHQPIFNDHTAHIHEGLPESNDEVFDGREPTLLAVDDHMLMMMMMMMMIVDL